MVETRKGFLLLAATILAAKMVQTPNVELKELTAQQTDPAA
jgi:hypothetical protein